MTDTKILEAHFAASRARLVAEGAIANAYNHKGNIGSIREAFVRELLENCTSKFFSVGAGEIIHRDMSVDEKRNQMDVVLYNNRYPKIPGAGGVDMFFVEAVSATVEVKSLLTKKDIHQAAQASKRIKSYPQAESQGFSPSGMVSKPRPYCLLFAYDAQGSLQDVGRWVRQALKKDKYGLEELVQTPWEKREFSFFSFLDGIFILNKGYIVAESMPLRRSEANMEVPADHVWIVSEIAELEMMWMILTEANERLLWNRLDVTKYATTHKMYLNNLKGL